MSTCTVVTAPCSLITVLQVAAPGDTISLADGSYDLAMVTLPPVPLHWVPTDPQTHPILTSAAAAPTLTLTSAQSGTTFDHLEIDNANGAEMPQPALQIGSGVATAIRSSIVNGRECIEASDAGPLTIERSTLTTTANFTCLALGTMSTLEASTVASTAGLGGQIPAPAIVTAGLVEDTTITGTLKMTASTAIARRVRATGLIGITGQGLVVDSLVQGTGNGSDAAAIVANAPQGGTLRVINTTAVSTTEPALLSEPVESPTGPAAPNDLEVTDSIARGASTDIQATGGVTCLPGLACAFGLIHIDHSGFATRSPLATAANAAVITEGDGNIADDPLFVDPGAGDYHLQRGSHAIDAGIASADALPTDLDGQPRVEGTAPDLGAYEALVPGVATGGGTGPGGTGHGGGGASGPGKKAAALRHLKLTPARFHVGGRSGGTTIRFELDAAVNVRLTLQREMIGHRSGKSCRTERAPGARCTILRTAGQIMLRGAHRGLNVFRFAGVLAHRKLTPAGYRLTAVPIGGKGQSARLTILPAQTRSHS